MEIFLGKSVEGFLEEPLGKFQKQIHYGSLGAIHTTLSYNLGNSIGIPRVFSKGVLPTVYKAFDGVYSKEDFRKICSEVFNEISERIVAILNEISVVILKQISK